MANRRIKFSMSSCKKLAKPPETSKSSEIEYTDTEVKGLKLAVSKTGQKAFQYRYTHRGKKQVIRIGGFPDFSVNEARKIARGYAARLAQGEDPKEEVVVQRNMPTLSEFVADMYLPYVEQCKRSHKADESKLRCHILPKFGSKRLDGISRYEIQSYLADLSKSLSAASSNRHLSLFSVMFKLAVEWNLLKSNPCQGLSKMKENPPPARDLTSEEVTKILSALEQESNEIASAALKLLFFTGLRLNEVLTLKWEDVDMAQKQMFLRHTKSGRGRYVPLNDEALSLLKDRQQAESGAIWVFPGKDPCKPLNNPRKAWMRALEKAGVEHARIHDIRHSFASACVRSGATLYSVQQLLGHSSPVTTQRYAHLSNDVLRKTSALAVDSYFKQAA